VDAAERVLEEALVSISTYGPYLLWRTLMVHLRVLLFVGGLTDFQSGIVIAWEALGNPGWNWKNFSKYVKKAET